ncbi:MAG: TolC family protein [Betaproteobacteria bacterium]|nr:TolC family protein [Betaproteobacteria bacterium]
MNWLLLTTHALFALSMVLGAATGIAGDFSDKYPRILREALTEATTNNPDVLSARKEFEAAQQRVAPAGALDDPMLEAGFTDLPTSLRFNREDMTQKMIGISQRIPYPGKRALRESLANRDADTRRYAYHEVVNRVSKEVKLAYFDLALAQESARLTEKNKRVLEQFLAIAESRYTVGLATQADVLKAQTQVAKMADELLKLAREQRNMDAELNRALGRGDEKQAPQPELPVLRTVSIKLEDLRAQARNSRPQLQSLQSATTRNDTAVELARKDYFPDFDIKLSYGQRDRMPTGERRDDMVSLTVAINLPVWGKQKIEPRVMEAIAMRDQAASMVRGFQNEINTRLRQEIANQEQSFKSARLYDNVLLPQARLTVESSLAAYQVNRVDFFTLLDNQMTVFNYEIAYVSAVVSQAKALAEIEFVTGGEL